MAIASTVTADNRLIAARTEFANAFGDLARGKRNWQLVAVWTLALLTILIAGYVRLAESARVVPYVVAVDRIGQVVAVEEVRPLHTPEPRLVAAQLAAFLRAVRTVLPASAPQLGGDVMRRAYAFVDQSAPAATTLNAYFSDPTHDPRVLGERVTRTVDVSSMLPVPNSAAWKARWSETEYPIQIGGTARSTSWEGYLTVRIRPPITADAIQDNPLGVFVTTIVWTQITDPTAHPSTAPASGGTAP
jgi:type IV secretory pathway TrbF-like protein